MARLYRSWQLQNRSPAVCTAHDVNSCRSILCWYCKKPDRGYHSEYSGKLNNEVISKHKERKLVCYCLRTTRGCKLCYTALCRICHLKVHPVLHQDRNPEARNKSSLPATTTASAQSFLNTAQTPQQKQVSQSPLSEPSPSITKERRCPADCY